MVEVGVATEMGVALVSLMVLFSPLLLLALVLDVTSKLFNELLLSRLLKRAGPGILDGRGNGWLSSSVRSIVSGKNGNI